MDPANAAFYAQREEDFEQRLSAADKSWQAQMAPYKGVKIVTYHRSWPNFADHFGLDVMGYVEPKGIQKKLSSLSPGDAAYFAGREEAFEKRLADAQKRWDAQMAPYKGRRS